MNSTPDHLLLSPPVREALKSLELEARRTVQGLMHGAHRGRHAGAGAVFDHHKEYSPGDPPRHMDWKASARSERYYIKRYLREATLDVHLVLDASASMMRHDGVAGKYDHARRLCAALACLVLQQNDRVALTVASDAEVRSTPWSARPLHLQAVLTELVRPPAPGGDGLRRGLLYPPGDRSAHGLCVIVSDLMFEPEPVRNEIARMAGQGHEVIVMHLRDTDEETFPFGGWVRFVDLENASDTHRLDATALAPVYRAVYAQILDDWRRWARACDVHLVSLRTDEPVGTVLARYLDFRRRDGSSGV